MLEDIKRNPDDSNGLGKPERLKENFQGYFSRRITAERRLVYKIIGDLIIVAQCRFHYWLLQNLILPRSSIPTLKQAKFKLIFSIIATHFSRINP